MNFLRNSEQPLTLLPLFQEDILRFFSSEIHDESSGCISTKFAMKFFRSEMSLPSFRSFSESSSILANTGLPNVAGFLYNFIR